MKIIAIIALMAVIAGVIVYRSNEPVGERPIEITTNCKDSYPPVVTRWQATDDVDRAKVSCKPDRFIQTHVPEGSL